MKSIYILFLLILFSAKISFAQDTLFMRNNTIILAKVLEVDAKEIKYNRFEVPNGPIYTEDKENINEIHYKNGLKDIFKLIDVVATDTIIKKQLKAMNTKIETDWSKYRYIDNHIGRKEASQLLLASNSKTIINLELKSEKARQLQYIGFVGIGFGAVATGAWFLGGLFYNNDAIPVGGCFALVAIPLGLTGIINNCKNKAYKHDAVQLYNMKY